jgi:AcrR family transcriptional regulator
MQVTPQADGTSALRQSGPHAGSSEVSARRPTQRDRQKQATRETLRSVARRLFVERGFRETTADEISAAAGVSRRTFFLHFASKDEVLLGHIADELGMLRAELEAASADLEPAARAGQAITRLAAAIQGRDELLLQLDLLHSAPELLGVNLEQFTAFEDAIADAVRSWLTEPGGRRLSADQDAFAELVGAVTMAALRAALNVWRRRGGRGQLHRLVATQVRRVSEGLSAP